MVQTDHGQQTAAFCEVWKRQIVREWLAHSHLVCCIDVVVEQGLSHPHAKLLHLTGSLMHLFTMLCFERDH